MSGLKSTFDTLTNTPNDSAVDVLIIALDDSDTDIRFRALKALVTRGDERSAVKILEQWDSLHPEDIVLIREQKQNFAEVIDQQIGSGSDGVSTAIKAAHQLDLISSLLTLITLAESSDSDKIKRQASDAVVHLVGPLGKLARQKLDQPTVRGPVLARLTNSVRCFSSHRNERLIEAFLEISAWSDGDLRLALEKPNLGRDLLCEQFKKTTEPGVIELLAGFVRRRDLPQCVSEVIQTRTDETFRSELLNRIGKELNSTTEKNLQDLGIPDSCRGGEEVVDQVEIDQLPALIHLYVTAGNNTIETLQVVAAAAHRGGEPCKAATAVGLSRCDTPPADFWMRAAIPVADGNESAIAANENARLLHRLIQLLYQADHADGALVRGVRHVLSPLHVDQIINRIEALRPRSRRRLGRVVMMIDPNAVTRIHDALRHPLLANRLKAISMAEALACVDSLSDSLAHIVREDHRDARILAAQVMADATNDATLGLLDEMIRLPDCGVRDAAMLAMEKRQSVRAGNSRTF